MDLMLAKLFNDGACRVPCTTTSCSFVANDDYVASLIINVHYCLTLVIFNPLMYAVNRSFKAILTI